MRTAASVAHAKIDHPERYCRAPRCLWRVESRLGTTPCPRHTTPCKWCGTLTTRTLCSEACVREFLCEDGRDD